MRIFVRSASKACNYSLSLWSFQIPECRIVRGYNLFIEYNENPASSSVVYRVDDVWLNFPVMQLIEVFLFYFVSMFTKTTSQPILQVFVTTRPLFMRLRAVCEIWQGSSKGRHKPNMTCRTVAAPVDTLVTRQCSNADTRKFLKSASVVPCGCLIHSTDLQFSEHLFSSELSTEA